MKAFKHNNIHRFIFTLCFFVFLNANGNSATDSLTKLLLNTKTDTAKANLYLKLAEEVIYKTPQKGFEYSNLALDIFITNKNKKGEAQCYFLYGQGYFAMSNYDSAKYFYEKSYLLFKNEKHFGLQAKTCLNIGLCNDNGGEYPAAIKNYIEALELAEQVSDTDIVTRAYNNIGLIYSLQGQTREALSYFFKCLQIRSTNLTRFKTNIGGTYINIGIAYKREQKYDSAIYYYEKALKIKIEFNDTHSIALCLNNIGSVNTAMEKHAVSLSYYQKALDLFRSTADQYNLAMAFLNISGAQSGIGDYNAAKIYLDSSFAISTKINASEIYLEVLKFYGELYNQRGDFKTAHDYILMYRNAKDSIYNIENTSAIAEMNQKYESEKTAIEIEKLEKHQELESIKISNSSITFYFLLGAAFAVTLLLLVLYRNSRIKKSTLKILSRKNEQLLEQKNDITDSINCALQIQESVLPSPHHLKTVLDNYFVLNLPRDVVSGDFYFAEKRDNKIIFSVIDCTGHGVPGALLTFLGMDVLQDAVKKNILKPSLILNQLDFEINQRLRQSLDVQSVKDGMDLSLCAFDYNTHALEYAGAFNPLYVVSENQLTEIKADKHPIGSNADGQTDEYTNHSIKLKKGDMVYLFTDGFADQFGGPRGKKFMYKQFKELLVSLSNLPLNEQKEKLHQTHLSWKGQSFQVDDICVMGIRV
jgi:serine phosphatase RsbU (regulator of sigma subunit)